MIKSGNNNENTNMIKKHSINELEITLSTAIEVLENEYEKEKGITRFYIIEKKTYTTKDISKQYSVYSVAIDSKLRDTLREKLVKKTLEIVLKRIKDETNDIPDFFELSLNDSGIVQASPQKIPAVEAIIRSLRERNTKTLLSIKDLKRLSGHAIEIKLRKNYEIIVFTRDKKNKLIKREEGFLARYFENEFQALQGDVLVIPRDIHAIYLKLDNFETILVLSRKNFEMLFNVKEYYEHYAKRILHGLRDTGLIKISDEVLEEAITKRFVSKNLTLLLKSNAFPFINISDDKNIEVDKTEANTYFKHLDNYIKKILEDSQKNSQNLKFDFEIKKTDNNVIFDFPKWTALKQFVSICKRDFLEDPISHTIYYAPRKKIAGER